MVKTMIIKNGLVFGEDKHFEKKDLYLNKGRIADAPGMLPLKKSLTQKAYMCCPV